MEVDVTYRGFFHQAGGKGEVKSRFGYCQGRSRIGKQRELEGGTFLMERKTPDAMSVEGESRRKGIGLAGHGFGLITCPTSIPRRESTCPTDCSNCNPA